MKPDRKENAHAAGARTAGKTTGFDLSWHLPHLLRRAHFEAEARFAEVYGDAATSRQLALLVAVSQSPCVTQSDVARAIGLDANTCSDLVRRTCAKGLLLRSRMPNDGRAYRLELSAEGLALVRGTALPLAEPYSARLAGRLTPRQRRELSRLLRLMLDIHTPSPNTN